ncbi:hypothetical protein [Pseudomonas sp. Marseille-Q5299]|uniref:hypothetical protein n=1 Tax=Pseudomonas sp. Marseille-Q5299 TaxID=2942201 RepID=UPI0020736D61|nr:hypothetical protein [Pseudomonas sp. Marseille-Q5299]
MEIGMVSLVDVITLLIALLSLVVAWWALRRAKMTELHALRQSIVTKAEQARSEWHKLNRENETLIRDVRHRFSAELPEVAALLDFLIGQREHFALCLRDSAALAEDVHATVDTFNEKKCRLYLRYIEPSLEKLARNQGVSTKRYEEILRRMQEASSPELRA